MAGNNRLKYRSNIIDEVNNLSCFVNKKKHIHKHVHDYNYEKKQVACHIIKILSVKHLYHL